MVGIWYNRSIKKQGGYKDASERTRAAAKHGDDVEMKKIRLISDPLTLYMAITMIVAHAIATVYAISLIREDTVTNSADILPIRLSFVFLFCALFIVTVIVSPRYLCLITLSETVITIWVPFRRKRSFTYKQFRNIYCGGYFHGNIAGVGRIVWYFVLSQRHLSTEELNQINLVPNSEEVVKIRYSRKTYEKLRMILPSDRIRQLESTASKILSRQKI